MKPAVEVKLADEDELALCAEMDVECRPYGWPTVIAKRAGEVVGFLSTSPRRDMVEAQALVADTPFTAMRLVEGYDNLLRYLGIKVYQVAVDRENVKLYSDLVRLGARELQHTEAHYVVERSL